MSLPDDARAALICALKHVNDDGTSSSDPHRQAAAAAARDALEVAQAEQSAWFLPALVEVAVLADAKSEEAVMEEAIKWATQTMILGRPATVTNSAAHEWILFGLRRELHLHKVTTPGHAADGEASTRLRLLMGLAEEVFVGLMQPNNVLNPTQPQADIVRTTIDAALDPLLPTSVRILALKPTHTACQNLIAFTRGAPNAPLTQAVMRLTSVLEEPNLDAQLADEISLSLYAAAAMVPQMPDEMMQPLSKIAWLSFEASESLGSWFDDEDIQTNPKKVRPALINLLACCKRADGSEKARLNAVWALGRGMERCSDIIQRTKSFGPDVLHLCVESFKFFALRLATITSPASVERVESKVQSLNVLECLMNSSPPEFARKLRTSIVTCAKAPQEDFASHLAAMVALMYGAEPCREQLSRDPAIESEVVRNLSSPHAIVRFYTLRALSEAPLQFVANNIEAIFACFEAEVANRKPTATLWNAIDLAAHLFVKVSNVAEKLDDSKPPDEGRDSEDDEAQDYGADAMGSMSGEEKANVRRAVEFLATKFEALTTACVYFSASPNPFLAQISARSLVLMAALPLPPTGETTTRIMPLCEQVLDAIDAVDAAGDLTSREETSKHVFNVLGEQCELDDILWSDARYSLRGHQVKGSLLVGLSNLVNAAHMDEMVHLKELPPDMLGMRERGRAVLERFAVVFERLVSGTQLRHGSFIAFAVASCMDGYFTANPRHSARIFDRLLGFTLDATCARLRMPIRVEKLPLHIREGGNYERDEELDDGKIVTFTKHPDNEWIEKLQYEATNVLMRMLNFVSRTGQRKLLRGKIFDLIDVPRRMVMTANDEETTKALAHMLNELTSAASAVLAPTAASAAIGLMVSTFARPNDDWEDLQQAAFLAQAFHNMQDNVKADGMFCAAVGGRRGIAAIFEAARIRTNIASRTSMALLTSVDKAKARAEQLRAALEADEGDADDSGADNDGAEFVRGGSSRGNMARLASLMAAQGSDSDGEDSDGDGDESGKGDVFSLYARLKQNLHDYQVISTFVPSLFGLLLRVTSADPMQRDLASMLCDMMRNELESPVDLTRREGEEADPLYTPLAGRGFAGYAMRVTRLADVVLPDADEPNDKNKKPPPNSVQAMLRVTILWWLAKTLPKEPWNMLKPTIDLIVGTVTHDVSTMIRYFAENDDDDRGASDTAHSGFSCIGELLASLARQCPASFDQLIRPAAVGQLLAFGRDMLTSLLGTRTKWNGASANAVSLVIAACITRPVDVLATLPGVSQTKGEVGNSEATTDAVGALLKDIAFVLPCRGDATEAQMVYSRIALWLTVEDDPILRHAPAEAKASLAAKVVRSKNSSRLVRAALRHIAGETTGDGCNTAYTWVWPDLETAAATAAPEGSSAGAAADDDVEVRKSKARAQRAVALLDGLDTPKAEPTQKLAQRIATDVPAVTGDADASSPSSTKKKQHRAEMKL